MIGKYTVLHKTIKALTHTCCPTDSKQYTVVTQFILERLQALHVGKSCVWEKDNNYVLQSPMFCIGHTFLAERGEKKEVKHHLQSTSCLQVQDRGAYYLKIANTAKCYNNQACMIMFHVQCLSTMASL